MTLHRNVDNDKELESLLDAIRELNPPRVPDVTDAVMQRVSTLPQPLSPLHDSRRVIRTRVASIAAACIAGIILFSVSLNHNKIQASNSSNASLSVRISDIYGFCEDYADDEPIENSTDYDNPMTYFI